MENNNKVLIIIIIILSVWLMGFGVYFLYDNYNDKEEPLIKEKSNLKLHNNQDWIYLAEYTYNVTEESFIDLYEEMYNVKEIIKVPYINIDSQDAKEVNNQIKTSFNEKVQVFNNSIEEQLSPTSINYKSYQNNNILSILIETTEEVIGDSNYVSYNFDLNTGKLVDFETLYKLKGFNADNIDNNVEEAIKEYLNEYFSTHSIQVDDLSIYITESIENYRNPYNEFEQSYFLDTNNILNITSILNLPVGHGYYEKVITLK